MFIISADQLDLPVGEYVTHLYP